VYLRESVCVFVGENESVCVFLWENERVAVWLCACVCVWLCVCVRVCVCVCVCVWGCVCVQKNEQNAACYRHRHSKVWPWTFSSIEAAQMIDSWSLHSHNKQEGVSIQTIPFRLKTSLAWPSSKMVWSSSSNLPISAVRHMITPGPSKYETSIYEL
jgi:hypothetical protein